MSIGDAFMSNVITANELKTKGISAISKATADDHEAIISVRGKNRYIVLPIKTYNYLRECELEIALAESKKDLKEGKYINESVEDHIKRLKIV